MRRLSASLVVLALALAAAPASAFDYRSVAEAAVMYDAPSAKASPLFVIARGTPVEVVVTVDGWLKVRDAGGALAWIAKDAVSNQRTLMVTVPMAEIRTQPDDKAPVVFAAEKDVVLELLDPGPPGWAKVRHQDGQEGYVRADQVWGL